MKNKYPVHKDYRTINIGVPMYAPLLPLFQRMTRFLYAKQSVPSTIKCQKLTLKSFDGYTLPMELFSPLTAKDKSPCILFLHGGAFALPASDFHKKLICEYALGSNIKVLFVDYRLVPKHPFPYGLEDCFAAYRWILEGGSEFAIDTNRIAICGDSAGGALAASLTHLVRDRNLSMPLFQMLIYPVLDARQQTDSMKRFIDTPIWNARQNKKMWNLYCKETSNHAYSSPAQTPSFLGLPKAYIEANEFDCLRDEAIEYARQLQQADIEVVLNQTKATVHGFELNWKSEYTQQIIKQRIAYMNQQLAVED
jgi:acetyl esterase/lipase